MIPRTQAGLMLERLFSTMHDWEGFSLRHLLCYNGESQDDSYDCACCMTWPDTVPECGCICHERIERMAQTLDFPLLISSLLREDIFPQFATSWEELQGWRKAKLDAGLAHYHDLPKGEYAGYPKSSCGSCILPPQRSVTTDESAAATASLMTKKIGDFPEKAS